VQIKEDFGKQPPVERIVGLELYFDEEPGIVAVLGRGEDAVEPESGLFDLFGTELIAVGATGVEPGEFECNAGPVAEEFVEQTVGFHVILVGVYTPIHPS
jgi:hypothetical protein